MPTSFRSHFSSFKNHNIAKGLIRISPVGYPSFTSELYAGRTGDKQNNYERLWYFKHAGAR